MELEEILRRSPDARQAVRFDANGRLDVSSGSPTFSPKDIVRVHDACAVLGRHLGLGSPAGLAMSDVETALYVIDTPEGSFAVVESAPDKDALGPRADALRAMLTPEPRAAFARRVKS
jgi:hypothetical protein